MSQKKEGGCVWKIWSLEHAPEVMILLTYRRKHFLSRVLGVLEQRTV